MPLPKPNKDETKDEFVSRFMSNEEAKKEFPEQKQRLAIAYEKWREKKKMATFYTSICKSWTDTVKLGDKEKEMKFFDVIVSGLREDRDGEVMDQSAIDDMILQFKSGRIPLTPDHGMKDSGERFYSWKDIMGVWVDARQEGDHLIATARLNNAHPDADLLWKYIKEEDMPVGFSIGGKPVNVVEEEILESVEA